MSESLALAERRAVLIGPSTMAALRANEEQHRRLGAQARERDRRLARAIRKASR